MADGFGVFGAGLANNSGRVSLGIGSSFAAPNVAGIAALLWNAAPPLTTATQIRNAIVGTGNELIILGGETVNDQGNGWVDASQALIDLPGVSGTLPTLTAPFPFPDVVDNVGQATVSALDPPTHLKNLEPGDRQDVIYEVFPGDTGITVVLSDIEEAMCSSNPAPFFGNELQVAIHTVKTSTVGPAGQYYDLNPTEGFEHAFIGESDADGTNVSGVLPEACDFLTGICSFPLVTLEPGLLRVSINGATTNACEMSVKVDFDMPTTEGTPLAYSSGSVLDGATVSAGSILVEPGDGDIEFQLSWDNDWTKYKGSDLELLVVMPGFPALPLGQTLDAPERFVINSEVLTALLGSKKPVPLPTGTWTMSVKGFEVNEADPLYPVGESWKLRVWIDNFAQLP